VCRRQGGQPQPLGTAGTARCLTQEDGGGDGALLSITQQRGGGERPLASAPAARGCWFSQAGGWWFPSTSSTSHPPCWVLRAGAAWFHTCCVAREHSGFWKPCGLSLEKGSRKAAVGPRASLPLREGRARAQGAAWLPREAGPEGCWLLPPSVHPDACAPGRSGRALVSHRRRNALPLICLISRRQHIDQSL